MDEQREASIRHRCHETKKLASIEVITLVKRLQRITSTTTQSTFIHRRKQFEGNQRKRHQFR
eukprot:scaffold5220_cov188-Amphora_coffeaeformis.AAC.4